MKLDLVVGAKDRLVEMVPPGRQRERGRVRGRREEMLLSVLRAAEGAGDGIGQGEREAGYDVRSPSVLPRRFGFTRR